MASAFEVWPWAALGAQGDGLALRDTLLNCYQEPHRRYHTLQHLGECLTWFNEVQTLLQRPAEVAMALWFHDAIYDLQQSDNEARSAAWALQALSDAGATRPAAQRVHDLVLATRHAVQVDEPDAQFLVDIDLAILGAPAARFAQYEHQVRDEYDHVPDEAFRAGRRAVLMSFLQRPRIYSTNHFFALLEDTARNNLHHAVQHTWCEPPTP
jgi:predicted metal-dependent HD superfamily phosphohydrolase